MIPGLPDADSAAVLALLKQQSGLEQVLLYGSRAMGRHHSGSDVDLCLVAPSLQLEDCCCWVRVLTICCCPGGLICSFSTALIIPACWRTSSGLGWLCSIHRRQSDDQLRRFTA